jgi:Ca2+-binding RTX toxin-like protein
LRSRRSILALPLGLVLLHALLPTLGAGAEAPRCAGLEATVVGTDEAETLTGTPGRDVILALGGADRVEGGGSADRICAGPGGDEVFGGLGSDRLHGASGDDSIEGGTGSDIAAGGAGRDRLGGGRGNDRLDGGPGDRDIVAGDLGDDRVLGGKGSFDEALGGLGIDLVNGGPGDSDFVEGGYGFDRMSGGSGAGDVGSFATAVARPGGKGVFASLRRGIARGDGRDTLRRLEDLEGSPFADVLIGDDRDNHLDGGPGRDRLRGLGGADRATGDSGEDRCAGSETRASCRAARRAGVVALVDPSPAGGAGLAVIGGRGADDLTVSYDPVGGFLAVRAVRPVGIGAGCLRIDGSLRHIACTAGERARHLTVDLGGGGDSLSVRGALHGLDSIRFAGGPGDDEITGGPGGELIEAGGGADVLRGGAGSDGLVGGIPGPDRLLGGRGSDLLAAGGACVGGVLRGGAGRDNASFAETPSHPGVLRASLAAGRALIRAIPGCRPVRLAASNEDLEGSFDWDILIGDAGANSLYGQPGRDWLFGRGGDDVIDAGDGWPDWRIDCGGGKDTVLRDRRDPPATRCEPA